MSNSAGEAVELPHESLRPLPEHLYEAMLIAVSESLGASWGRMRPGVARIGRRLREVVSELDGVYVAAELHHDEQRGVHIQLWVDRDDLDLQMADDILHETLRGLGDREILAVCRSFERDGIHFQFVAGSIESGLIGNLSLVGPYAREVARLALIGSGQPMGFSA